MRVLVCNAIRLHCIIEKQPILKQKNLSQTTFRTSPFSFSARQTFRWIKKMISNFYIFTARFIVQFCHFVFSCNQQMARYCVSLLLILLSGDVELNPGPPKRIPGSSAGPPKPEKSKEEQLVSMLYNFFASSLTHLKKKCLCHASFLKLSYICG